MNKRNYLSLAVVALVSSASALAADLNSEGIKAYRAGDYQRAEKLYRQVLAEETDSTTLEAAYNNLAVLYQAQGKDSTEFTAEAAKLAKSRKPRVLSNDSPFSMQPGVFLKQAPKDTTADAPEATARSAQTPAGGASPQQTPSSGSPPLWVNSGMQNIRTNSSFGVNTPFGGFQRNTTNNYGMPGFGYPGAYGSGYSMQGPNGSVDYSDASPVILNAPNGQPVIIRAPGPNTSATQQNPDGSSTTIINRTY